MGIRNFFFFSLVILGVVGCDSNFQGQELSGVFSNSDNIRSIASGIDGFKPSQRKVLFGCLKRKLYSEIRVAQLAGYISEHCANSQIRPPQTCNLTNT